MLELYLTPLSEIPMVYPSKNESLMIENIANKIISIKKVDKNANTVKLEKQIDEVVYKLYDLTTDEIKIIEEHYKS